MGNELHIIETSISLDNRKPKLFAIDSDNDTAVEINDSVYNIRNVILINNVEYVIAPINPSQPGNKGGNSFVFKVIPVQGGVESVIKISNKPDTYKRNIHKQNINNKRFYREITALYKCKCLKHIIDIYIHGLISFWDKDRKAYYPFYMMEYAPYDLKSYFENIFDDGTTGFDRLELENKITLCLQIAKGINDLHEIGCYHRDIKPDNILFFDNNIWKVGDLGLISSRKDDYDKTRDWIGPRGWMSPEAMNKFLAEGLGRDKRIDCDIDESSDVFQLGKVFWYIMQGNAPIGNIARTDFFEKDEAIYSVIRNMLNHSKKKRRSLTQIIEELSRIQAALY